MSHTNAMMVQERFQIDIIFNSIAPSFHWVGDHVQLLDILKFFEKMCGTIFRFQSLDGMWNVRVDIVIKCLLNIRLKFFFSRVKTTERRKRVAAKRFGVDADKLRTEQSVEYCSFA